MAPPQRTLLGAVRGASCVGARLGLAIPVVRPVARHCSGSCRVRGAPAIVGRDPAVVRPSSASSAWRRPVPPCSSSARAAPAAGRAARRQRIAGAVPQVFQLRVDHAGAGRDRASGHERGRSLKAVTRRLGSLEDSGAVPRWEPPVSARSRCARSESGTVRRVGTASEAVRRGRDALQPARRRRGRPLPPRPVPHRPAQVTLRINRAAAAAAGDPSTSLREVALESRGPRRRDPDVLCRAGFGQRPRAAQRHLPRPSSGPLCSGRRTGRSAPAGVRRRGGRPAARPGRRALVGGDRASPSACCAGGPATTRQRRSVLQIDALRPGAAARIRSTELNGLRLTSKRDLTREVRDAKPTNREVLVINHG